MRRILVLACLPFLSCGGAVAGVLPVADDPVALHETLAASGATACEGRRVRVVVAAAEGLELAAGRALYRMGFNQVTEGWNWHPEAAAEEADYYRFKYLPLARVDEARGRYAGEDKVGTAQEFRIAWRTDYFLAFDNLYDFFPRRVDDDAGFAAAVGGVPAEAIGLAAEAVLHAPCTAQSTTFWKATHARPVDFTLKKRYLLGELLRVEFIDRRDGHVIAVQEKSTPAGRAAAAPGGR